MSDFWANDHTTLQYLARPKNDSTSPLPYPVWIRHVPLSPFAPLESLDPGLGSDQMEISMFTDEECFSLSRLRVRRGMPVEALSDTGRELWEGVVLARRWWHSEVEAEGMGQVEQTLPLCRALLEVPQPGNGKSSGKPLPYMVPRRVRTLTSICLFWRKVPFMQ